MNLKNCKILFILLVFSSILYSQTSEIERLQKLRLQYQTEIKNAEKLLSKKGKSRNYYLKELKILNSKINSQKNVISTYESEIKVISLKVEENKKFIDELALEIEDLKKGYEKLIIEANRQLGSNLNEFMIVFSSGSFSEAYRRFNLLKQYSSYRKRQGVILEETKLRHDSILAKNNEILEQKTETYNLLNEELESIKIAISSKENFVGKLKSEERWLRKDIEKKKRSTEDLQKELEKLILEASKNTSYSFSNFSKAKGRLIWPVKDGIVTNKFGEHNHAVLKGVKVKNNGIDITTLKENDVKCVYEGTVSRVIAIPGYNKAVIVRHGKFLTVYANLVDVYVKNGDIIQSNQEIGQIYSDTNEKSGILHFEIWEESKKINPEDWLLKFN